MERRSYSILAVLLSTVIVAAGPNCRACDLLLHNGQILTLDAGHSIQSSIAISGTEILAVGVDVEDCAEVLDLGGRTVIPGLIDNHVHWMARGSRPGHHVGEMDRAVSVAQSIEILNRQVHRAPAVTGDATADNFLTAVGAITVSQFTEGRLPNATELAAVPRPVFLSAGFSGPSQTNEAGRDYFEDRGIAVNPDGSINNTNGARAALDDTHDEDDIRRNVIDTMGWSASVGLTTAQDFGSNTSPALDSVLDIAQTGEAFIRLRLGFGGFYQNSAQVNNAIDDLLGVATPPGSEMVRATQLGEFINNTGVSGTVPLPASYPAVAAVVAARGIGYHQHAIPDIQASAFLDAWELINQTDPITSLRWQLGHVFDISTSSLDRLDALGAGFSMQAVNYAGQGGGNIPPGPPYRTALLHGLPVSAGTDGGNIVTIDPWNALYFMTTGLDDSGAQMLPAGEAVTVTQALELYTKGSAWFISEEDRLGSLEVGKLADLVVLTDDVLAIEDSGSLQNLRRVKSVLTIVDGKIIYSDGSLLPCADSNPFGEWFPTFAGDTCTGSVPQNPPAVPDGGAGTVPMTATRLDPPGSQVLVDWDTSSCGDNASHVLIYGEGSGLPGALGQTYTLTGAECEVGGVAPFTWTGAPTAGDGSGLIWWLMLVDDGAGTEASWGQDFAGAERDGPGFNGSSGQCAAADKDLTNTCGQ
jgi:predicted amidohydrolase YtcJ